MNFLKKLFSSKDEPIHSYADFWNWFEKNEKEFFKVVSTRNNIPKNFFDKLSPKLAELKDGYFFVTGMFDDNTAELVLTADGSPQNIVFVEELVAAAPSIQGWKFTALKPALNIENVSIDMGGLSFDKESLGFYANDTPAYPDEIDIIILHKNCTEENKNQVLNGVYIFLDNYLGELGFLNNIDILSVKNTAEAEKEIIPVEKLKDYLVWRQKEFIEKYEGTRYNTEDDSYSMMEATLQNGKGLVAVVNTQLLEWDRKASHPWIAVLTIAYNGSDNNGMPGEADYELLNTIDDEIMLELKDSNGQLNIGRQTADGEREIYFACKDFRQVSKTFFETAKKYAGRFEISSEIYKDKYWQSFERFSRH